MLKKKNELLTRNLNISKKKSHLLVQELRKLHTSLSRKSSQWVCDLCFVPISQSNLLSGNKAVLAETALLA